MEIGFYWIKDEKGDYFVAEYAGNDEWYITGCAICIPQDPYWEICNKIDEP